MEIATITIETLKQMFAEGKRFDGRKLDEYRPLTLSFDVSNKAEGSARVLLGNTDVVAGVKLGLGEPYPDSPDKGNLVVSAELIPLASPRFEGGPPNFESIELARLVDRVIRESSMIDLSKLVITPGEKVWNIFVDIYPINDDGNLIDAATIAAVAALKKAKIPVLDKDGKIDYEKESKELLPVFKEILPLSISFFKLGSSIVMDPTREEEEAMETRITLGASFWEKQFMINACQKSGKSPLTRKEFELIINSLQSKYLELNERLKKFF